MAEIRRVGYEEADGVLADLYDRYARPDGGLDNIIRVHSLNPRSMEGHVRYYAHIVKGPSPLSKARREMIAVAVSAANACFNYVNRMATGLGVELEECWDGERLILNREEFRDWRGLEE